ncbi:hypothetical protein KEM56_007618 [Ascosphaera pollenicola]|nr:hypothetical protein KEM56_007618 [Ascosphaera pollenicola]
MPTDIHESATAVAMKMVCKALVRVKMWRAMREVGHETITGVDHNQGKEPDAAYRLKLNYARKYDLKKYPQIVIETGYSETKRDLGADVRHWLQQGNQAVRLVLTVRAVEDSFELSAWTLSSRGRHVIHEGEISATLDKNGSFKLRRGSAQKIVIPFVNLFFREPDVSCGEGDVEFRAADFLDCCDGLEEAYRDVNPWGQEKAPLPPPRSKRPIPMDDFSDALVKPRKSKIEG